MVKREGLSVGKGEGLWVGKREMVKCGGTVKGGKRGKGKEWEKGKG